MPVTKETRPLEAAPVLSAFPDGMPERLVDGGLLHYEASVAGFSERYRRGETPQTVHVWWARRPHRAMRALVFASLCHDNSDAALDQLRVLAASSVPQPSPLRSAREFIKRKDASPRLLDMFGGGGTIAYEASVLGAETHTIDSNELAVFIQKCLLEYSKHGDVTGLSSLVASSGKRILDSLAEETRVLFPLRERVFGYLWTYSMACPDCGYRYFLSKRPWVSKKRGKRLAFVVHDGDQRQTVSLRHVGQDFTKRTAWAGRDGTVVCPRCESKCKSVSITNASDEVVAIISHREPNGKAYSEALDEALPTNDTTEQFERRMLESLGAELPCSRLPQWSGIVNPALYGMQTHSDFLGHRQRAVLLALVKCLRDEYDLLRHEHGEKTAKTAICLLSGMVDQLVDWNCRLSMWISQNEQVGRAFSGPGVAMLWDYAETDPVLNGPANLWKKLDRIVAGTRSLQALDAEVDVKKGYAQQLPFESEYFDAIVTDPPYYDNVYYNVLADFFFSWKRLLFQTIEPRLFAPLETDSQRELVASTFRSGDAAKAHEDYCQELHKAIGEAERVLKKDGVFCLVYSHSSLRGWEAIVRAYRPTGLRITSVQPLSIERKARPRAMKSDAVNTCVVFVAHRVDTDKRPASLSSLCASLGDAICPLITNLASAGWNDADIGVAAFAQGVALLSNVTAATGCAGDLDVLQTFEGVIRAHLPNFRIVNRKSL